MLHSEFSNLDYEWRHLERQVADTHRVWNDSKRTEFDKQHWENLTQAMPSYLQVLSDLAETIEHIRHSIP